MQLTFLETLGIKNLWLRRLVAFVVATYLVIVFVPYLATLPRQRLIDLFVQYTAARVMAVHGNIYSFDELRAMADKIGDVQYGTAFSNLLLAYTHPPSDTFFDLRWTPLDYPNVKIAYLIVSAILYLASLVLIWHTLKPMMPRVLHWIFPAILFVLFIPTRASLGLGQSDITIFFLMVVLFWAFSRGRNLIAGVALALAIMTKIAPAILLVYFAWKREGRVIIYTMVAGAVVALLSLPIIGFDLWFRFVREIFPTISTGTSYIQNQSLPAFINRLMLDPKYAQGLQSAPSVPSVRAANAFAELMMIALAMFFSRGRLVSRQSPQYALEYAIWLTVLLIVSPITWDHYFTWLVLPIAVLGAVWLNSRMSLARLAIHVAVFVGALWLVDIPTRTFFGFTNVWMQSPYLYGACIILLLLLERRFSFGYETRVEAKEMKQLELTVGVENV